MFRPPFPYVNWRGVAQAASAVLKDVSNHRAIVRSPISPFFNRSGRLPPELETEVVRLGVNGSPDWIITIVFICQPPRIWLATLLAKLKRFPFPTGSSQFRL